MGNDSELSIIVRAKNEASRVLEQVNKDAKSVGHTVATGFKNAVPSSAALAAGVAAAGAATVAFGVSSFRAYAEAEQAAAQLEAVIKSTGGAAGLTSQELMKQATALQGVTKFSDEAVMATQSMLLTFTQIKGGVVKDATKTALDMAQALGMEGSQAAMQLGKALNDPISGLTKLTRVGVTFSAEQEKQVKAMVEAGDVAGAQGVILGELQKEFGGSAEAAGSTFAGQLEILKNTFGDLQEGIGQMIAGALAPLASKFSEWMGKVNEAGGLMAYFKQIVNENKDVLQILAVTLAVALVPALIAAGTAVVSFMAPLLPFIAVGVAIGFVITRIANALGGWGPLFERVKGIALPIFGLIKQAIEFLRPSFESLVRTITTQLWPALQKLWDQVAPILLPALKVLGIIIGVVIVGAIFAMIKAVQFWVAVITKVVGVITWFVSVGRTQFNIMVSVFRFLVDFFATGFRQIGQWGSNAVKAIVAYFQWSKNTIISVWNAVIGFFRGIPSGIGRAVAGVTSAITAPFERAVQLIKSIPGRIVSALGNVGNMVRNTLGNFDIPGPLGKVRDVIPGFASGVENFGGGLAYVHKGEVLANLPPGTDVITAAQSRKMLEGSGGGVTNNFYGEIRLDSDAAVDRFFERLNRATDLARQGAPV